MTRRVPASILLAVLVVTAGCTSVFSGPITASASEVTVSDAALEDTGFQHNRTEKVTLSQNVSAAGQSKKVEVTNWVSEYRKTVSVAGLTQRPVATFVVVSTPNVEVLGESFNPLAKFDERRLVRTFTSATNSVGGVQQVGTRNVSMLGNTTEVTEFEATVTTATGVEFDAVLHVTRVEHDGDFVVAVAVHPAQLDGEADVNRLLRGVEHGG